MQTREIFLLSFTKQIGMCPIRKAAEGKSALAQEQMGLNRPQIHLRWQREVGGSGVGQDRSLIKHGKEFDAFINGVWSPPKAGNLSQCTWDPTSVPKSHCTFFASLLPTSHTFTDPHFQHHISRIKVQSTKTLDATKIWMLLMDPQKFGCY